MAETQPGITDIKLLYARSGNRCAFPKCSAPMALNSTLLGEICHIKGEKPGSARHDPQQTNIERHEYGNLILMCPTHHTVIDDDPDSYTVDRLREMKAKHEGHATPIPDAEASQVAKIYVDQTLTNIGQSGGLAANIVNAQNITLHSGPVVGSLAQERQMKAIEILWQACRDLRKEFGDLILVETVLLPAEISSYFENGEGNPFLNSMHQYRDEQTILNKYNRAKAEEAEKERPFVGHRLWAVFYVLRGLYGRAAFLLQLSFKKQRYQNWREDSGIDQLLRTILPAHIVDQVKKQAVYGFQTAIDYLENQFLAEAGMRQS